MSTSTLIRTVRPVPVRTRRPYTGPVDLRIRDGRIVDLAPELAPAPDDIVVDAEGRWAIPGLWDQHAHMTWWAQSRSRLDVSSARSAADVVALVADHLERLDSPRRDSPILGFGFRPALWAAQPRVADLDGVSGDHPVILSSGDGHTGWLNSAALRLLGLTPRTGAITETLWFSVQSAITELTSSTDDTDELVRAAVADAAARGVVGIVDFEFAGSISSWRRRFAMGIDDLRVRATVYPAGLDDAVAESLRTGSELDDRGLLAVGPLKIFADGSLNARTALCFEPYADADDLAHPRGEQIYTVDDLTALVRRGHRNGFAIALHAIGDRAVDVALSAFETTGAQGGIEHAQLIRPIDIPRMRALGVRASVQPAHLLDDQVVTRQCWPDRMDRCFALRSLLRGGVDVALGSDAPVSALDPWVAMAAAVHRAAGDDEPWNVGESLTVGEALAASTDGQPTLAVGGRGDVVLLDADPLRPAPTAAESARRLPELPVAATFVGGRITHSAL
ncbi:amidohydrolase [Gordonia insulae]|uniref:amidohydrolase n=1 Tax=Gordonia insulae TaxID=2420509 RepID=UPI001E63915D|nr:amidohydrolase family protein [Gordonia insulae]